MAFSAKLIGFKELKKAIDRSPGKVLSETRKFITRGLAVYKAGIIRSPWRVGSFGGGVPVSNDPRYPRPYQRQRSGNLRDTHMTTISGLQGWIGPSEVAAPYARWIHGGTRRMKARPWLDYVKRDKASEIRRLHGSLLQNIVRDLAK